MNNEPIIWTYIEEKNRYFSDSRYEFIIYKEGYFWILTYTDFWSCELEGSVFVNIKSSGPDMFALRRLKKYAQKVADEYEVYLENDKLNDNYFLGSDLTEEERKKLISEYVKTFRENEQR